MSEVMVCLRLSLLVILVLPVFSSQDSTGESTTVMERDTGSASVYASILEKLEVAKSEHIKYGLIKELANSNTVETKSILVKYFLSLPPSPVTTNPSSDTFKARIFELILPLLEQSEKRKFIMNTLDGEISNMRDAQNKHFGNMYPVALWNNIKVAIESDEDFSIYNDKFSSMAHDNTLPNQFRVDALVKSEQYKSSADTENKIINDILTRLNAKPESYVPWEFYNDPEKRIAYCKGSSYANMLMRSSMWRMAGNEVKYESDLKRLKKFGIKAIEVIIDLLANEDLNKDFRNALAEVAGEIFASLGHLSDPERIQAEALEEKLRAYINTMQDKGAFCRRYYAIQGLSAYYRMNDIKGRKPFESGMTPNGEICESSSDTTNLINAIRSKNSLGSNHSFVTKKTSNYNYQKKNDTMKALFVNRWIILLSSVVLGCIAAYYLWKRKSGRH